MPVLNFCTNRLSSHLEVIKAGQEAIDTHGADLSSVRFICCVQDIHRTLDQKLAKFHAARMLFSMQLALIPMEDFSRRNKKKKERLRRVIATYGIFSMEGDVAPSKEICDLADRCNAHVFVDECHATGFFGPANRSTEKHLGLADIINSTLGKGLGGTMDSALTLLVLEFIDTFRFGRSIKVLDLLSSSSEFTTSLKSNISNFRKSLTDAGFKVIGNPSYPICPVFLDDTRLASTFAD
ncbi:unnamed protein product [Onchocerca flexuosa]|uniref:Aminotran_1_2 domain-containing protein n=1 Tax=Onchocerca flexuosa TaxID=387005 RepID=A0A183H014_9BILA|nr:unnamed protein product [Onchocerca flexuosa]